MSSELAEFLAARYDEDEAAAQKHACALDCMGRIHNDWHSVQLARGRGDTVRQLAEMGLGLENVGAWSPDESIHLMHPDEMHGTALDPSRVLAEVEAKRRIVAQYERAMENRRAHPDDLASAGALLALHGVVTLLALPYASHPDYDERWRP